MSLQTILLCEQQAPLSLNHGRHRLICGLGPRKVEALPQITAQLTEPGHRTRVLNPLGHHCQIQAMPQSHHRLDKGPVRLTVLDKDPVDLENVHGE